MYPRRRMYPNASAAWVLVVWSACIWWVQRRFVVLLKAEEMYLRDMIKQYETIDAGCLAYSW